MQNKKNKRNETDAEASRRWDNEGGHFEEQSLQEWPATSAIGSSDVSSKASEAGQKAAAAATQGEKNKKSSSHNEG